MSPRPAVLGYPSPTTSRYVILAAALLASGLYVGNWAHTQIRGDQWTHRVLTCETARSSTTPADPFRAEQDFERCTAHVERVRAAFSVGGMVVAGAAAGIVLFLAPMVVVRRRRLRAPGPGLAGAVDRFDQLAREAGVGDRVRPLVGTSRQRDAFSFGAPGRYRVALPPAVAVRWRDPRLFDPLVRHELAHAKQRDIALAWLTRSVWYALVPILAFPVAAALVDGDTSLLGDYLWRAALLAGVVALLSAALLRSREYVADLRAAQWEGDPALVEAVVGAARPGPSDGVRRLLAKHPRPTQRVEVLRSPGLLVRAGFVDGLVGAFLGGLAVPLIVGGISPALTGSRDSTDSYLVASLLLGPVLGASVGLAVWRDALFGRVTGDDDAAGRAACGVGVGLVAGQVVSLGGTATGLSGGLSHPAWLAVSAVAGAGVTILSAGLARLWTDAAPRLGSLRACWVVALVVNAVLFTVLLWSTSLFQIAADGGGWAIARSELTLGLTTWPMFWTVLALAVLALLPLLVGRREQPVPRWLVESPDAGSWRRAVGLREVVVSALVAVIAGLLAGAVIVGYRLGAGAAPTDELLLERFLAYQWVVALAAAVAVAVTVLGGTVAGPGLAAALLPVTTLLGSAGWFVLNVSLGGASDLHTALLMVRPATVMGFYAAVAVTPVAYGVTRLPSARVRLPATAAVATAAVVVVATGALALGQRQQLVAPEDLSTSSLSQPLVSPSGGDPASYLAQVVPVLTRQYAAVDQFAQDVLGDPTLSPAQKADALEAQAQPAVAALLAQWQGFRASGDVARTHEVALAALRTSAQKYDVLVAALRSSDQAGLARAVQLGATEAGLWAQWRQWQTTLAAE